MISSMLPHMARHVDEMAFIHSMTSRTNTHGPGCINMNTCFTREGFPSAGAWVNYALGSLNQNLPTYVAVQDIRGEPPNGKANWSNGFLSAQYQAVAMAAQQPLRNLVRPASINAEQEQATRDFLKAINDEHAAAHPGNDELRARMASYELAAKMQLAAPEALDISKESDAMKAMYGIQEHRKVWPTEINPEEEADYMGRKCLAARRLLERGVRFVQIWSGNDNGFPRRNWDSHEDVERDHGPLAWGMAKAVSALILDLKQRGLLDETIILWTTEFGRMPSTQGGKGRDHNPYVFTNWLCGGGIQGGVTAGESDQWGYKPLDRANPTTCYDIHATLLHQLGIDHTQLTVRHNGIDRRLTDVHGQVIRGLVG
jgi:hypothetical protein